MNPSSVSLKGAVIVHFVLTIWASMSPYFLPDSYIYMNMFVLLIGVFAIVMNESVDAVFMGNGAANYESKRIACRFQLPLFSNTSWKYRDSKFNYRKEENFTYSSYLYSAILVGSTETANLITERRRTSHFLFFHCFTMIQDIIFLGVFEPMGHDYFERPDEDAREKNLYRFSLGMCILNLILKPVTAILLYRIWQDRQGHAFDLPFNIPGIPGMGNQHDSKYENIDQSVPSSNYVETASAPRGIDDPHVTP